MTPLGFQNGDLRKFLKLSLLFLFFLPFPPSLLPADSLQKDLGQWYAEGRIARMEEAIRRRIHEEPSNLQAWMEWADLKKSLADCAGEEAVYRDYLARYGKTQEQGWRIEAALGLALERCGKYGQAEEILQKLLPQHPRQEEILWGLALVKIHQARGNRPEGEFSRKSLKDARKLLEELTVLKPGFPLGFWELAEVSRELKDVDGALRAYREVLRLDGSYKQAYPHIARLLSVKKQYSQSLVEFEKAMAIAPEDKKLRKEAREVSRMAPKAAARRKLERKREWEGWKVPPKADLAASPATVRVGIFSPLGNLWIRSESDLWVRTPAQTPLTVLPGGKDYRVVYLPAEKSTRRQDTWLLKASSGKKLLTFTRRLWLSPRDARKPILLHAVPSNQGYFFAKEEDQAYRGVLEISPRTGKGFQIINRVSLEDYTAGVLPSEMPSSWPLEALKAQAVVVRSYALSKMGRHNARGFDLCDSVHCAAYRGVGVENGRSDEAVNATAGQVLKAGRNFLSAVFSAQCGGHTQDYRETWGYDLPVVGVKDYAEADNQDLVFPLSPLQLETWVKENRKAYCYDEGLKGYRNYRWAVVVPAADLARKSAGVGRIRNLSVARRSQAGWAETLLVEGEKGQKTVVGDLIRGFLGGLRSNLFWIETQFDGQGWPDEFFLYGGGWGHGVGMCQVGASSLAKAGKTYGEILRYYFPKAELKKL